MYVIKTSFILKIYIVIVLGIVRKIKSNQLVKKKLEELLSPFTGQRETYVSSLRSQSSNLKLLRQVKVLVLI